MPYLPAENLKGHLTPADEDEITLEWLVPAEEVQYFLSEEEAADALAYCVVTGLSKEVWESACVSTLHLPHFTNQVRRY